jgi:hypothetical protein
MHRRLSPKRGGILAALVLAGMITFTLLGWIAHLQPAHAATHVRALPASSISNVLATFYPNPSDSGTFNVGSASPAFTQPFPTLDFNPPTNFQFCSTSSGINENTRPFTNLSQNPDGSCTPTVAQGNGQQAGTNNLFSFQAELLATLAVPQAGQFDMNIYADDGWILSIGTDGNGDQPMYVAGPMNNAPATGKGPFTGYRVIGANNGPSAPALFTVTASFPAAGSYPIEIDYTECCGGQLTLVVGELSSSTLTPTPLPSTTPMPGGTWITSSSGSFMITGDTLHFAAHVNRLNFWDPPIDHVNFTAYFLGVNPNVWVICQGSSPTPGTTDVYECDWNLSPSVPNGMVTVSFDVYDTAGNKTLAPNGTLQGTISRTTQPLLLAPMPAGTTLKIIHGYNDPLPGQPCPQPGNGIADHCMNQQYGLDFQPVATSSNPHPSQDIIAPIDGTVAWVQNDRLGLRLDVGDMNLTICHFSSFKPNIIGTRVARGDFLGTMNGHIHLSIDDRYLDATHSSCWPSNARTCRPIPFNGGYYTIEGQSFDPGFDSGGNPIQDQWDGTTMVSSNQEHK